MDCIVYVVFVCGEGVGEGWEIGGLPGAAAPSPRSLVNNEWSCPPCKGCQVCVRSGLTPGGQPQQVPGSGQYKNIDEKNRLAWLGHKCVIAALESRAAFNKQNVS